MSLWAALEDAARKKLDLPEHYQICDVELLPHVPARFPGEPRTWKQARVALGIKLTGYGHSAWVDIKRTTIRPDDIVEKGGSDD